jgi:acetylornithine deacetylase/succinyl-diaminopimelate desuccinylase-like protein
VVVSTEDLLSIHAGLTAFPHRGSGTAYELQAASFLRDYLTARGHTVESQFFAAPRTYSWELLGICTVLAIGGLYPATWLVLLGAYWFWAYFSGVGTPWDRWFHRARSQNLISRASSGPRKLVVMAHYDSAKTFFVYDPKRVRGFRLNFLINAGLAGLLIPAAIWAPLLARLIAVYFLVQAGLLLHRERTAPYVNGANDNASGVAVAATLFLDLAAAAIAGTEIWLLLTGAEEVGAQGARAFLRQTALPRDTLILNIDNVGAGELYYATGEGMLEVISFRGQLVEAAFLLEGAKPITYTLAYFDTLPFARAGYPCLTLIRLENGLPPNWHWPTDTSDTIDYQAMRDTLGYARTLAQAVTRR